MRPRIIYVIGKGRSGSTLLGDFLGSLPGVFHTGELNKIWEYCLLGGHSCACGAKLLECPIWSEIIQQARRDDRCAWCFENPADMIRMTKRWHTFRGWALSKILRVSPARYIETLEGVLAAVQSVTECHTVVDTSKWPLDPRFFLSTDTTSSEIIHLVRNPWSVAQSWEMPKKVPFGNYSLPTFSKLFSACSWTVRVLISEWVRRRYRAKGMLVHYEGIAHSPERNLNALAKSLNLEGAGSLLNKRRVELAPGHTVMGNPSRFAHGNVLIKSAKNPPYKSKLISVLTWPARRLVGY